jgi:hypothetical protein
MKFATCAAIVALGTAFATAADAARYYEVSLTGALVSELGRGPGELNTGVDPNLDVGDVLTLTARFSPEWTFEAGGQTVAGLYGLPTSGEEFWRIDGGGMTWRTTDELLDGFPFHIEGDRVFGLPSITFAGGKVVGVGGEMLPAGNSDRPLLAMTGATFHIEPGEGLYGNIYDSQGFAGVWDLENSSAILTGIPEPATWAMMISGFGLIGGILRLRRATVSTGLA